MAAGQGIRAGRAFVEVFLDSRKLARGLKLAATKLKNFGASVRGLGQRMAAGLALPAFGVFRIISAFARFEKTMSRVKSLTQATTTQFAMLNKEAQRLGRTTVFTASQVADAMSEFALGGLEVQQIMDVIAPSLNLAAAAQMDVAESALIAVKTMNALQLKATDMGRITDVLTGGFTNSATTLLQLGDAMRFIGPLAEKAGLSIETTVAAIGLLSSSGEAASKAGTGLRGMLTRLTNPPAQAAAKLKELGITVADANDNVKPFAQIIGELEDALKGMGTAGKLAALGKIFPNRQIGAAAILIGEGSQSLRQFTKDLENSGGLAASVAAIQLNNLTGTSILLTSALEGLSIEIGKVFGGSLRIALNTVIKMVRSLSMWIVENRTLVLTIGLTFTALVALAGIFIATGIALQLAAFVLAGFGAALGVVAGVVGFLLSPLGLVAVAITAIGVAVLNSLAPIRLYGGTIKKAIGEAAALFTELEKHVEETLGGIADALSGGDLELATEILWASLRLLWLRGVGKLASIWRGLIKGVTAFARAEWDNLVVALNLIWDQMGASFTSVVDFMSLAWAKFVGFVKKTQNGLTKFLAKAMIRRERMRNPDFDVQGALAQLDDDFAEEALMIDIGILDLIDAQEKAAENRRMRAASDLNNLVAALAAERGRLEAARIDKNKKDEMAAAEEIAALTKKRDDALAKAKDVRTKSGKKTVEAINSLSRQVRRNRMQFN